MRQNAAFGHNGLNCLCQKINSITELIFLFHTSPLTCTNNPNFMILRNTAFGNIVGRGENFVNQQFLLFPQFFPPLFFTVSKREHHLSNTYHIVCKRFDFRPVQNFVMLQRADEVGILIQIRAPHPSSGETPERHE